MSTIHIGMDTDKVERDFTRAYTEKLTDRIAELEKEISNVTTNAKEVLADARNTLSVRKGFEMSGYVKHYIVSREDFNALKETK
jgi:uncharacterized protein (UPF0335 family)